QYERIKAARKQKSIHWNGVVRHGGGARRFSRGEVNVRFGSLADIRERIGDVGFTLQNGHAERGHRCPLSANSRHQAPNHRHADFSIVVPVLIYFSAEKDVGVSIWLLMLATMGTSRSLSSRTLCQAGSFWNVVHLVSRSASDSHGSM